MNETQLIDELSSAMHDAAAGVAVPPGAAQRARKAARRRRAITGLLATATGGAVAAAVTIALSGPGPGAARPGPAVASPHHQPPGPAAPAKLTNAYVVSHVEAALRGISHFIVRSAVTGAPGQIATTTDLDPVTGTTRSVSPGGVTYWTVTTVAHDRDYWHTVEINSAQRTWWTADAHSRGLGIASSGPVVVPSTGTSVAQIRRALHSGEFVVGRRGHVNGHDAIELVLGGKFAAKRDAFRYWVDAVTFQPVEMQFPPFTAASTITVNWIQKTPALVKQTNTPHVPSGYRKVAAPHWFN
jgi:hypothetical protein